MIKMNMRNKPFLLLLISIFSGMILPAQERMVPLSSNINYWYGDLVVRGENAQWQVPYQRAGSLTLPFKDDFYYATYTNYAKQNLWSDSSVYINTGKAIAPLSIGVATFDGLNKKGAAYNPNLVSNSSFAADTLTSKPINLLTKGTLTLTPADSVALTFYYQGRGYGDMPEPGDSLLVDFFKPRQQKWVKNVWGVPGFSNANTNDTIFKRAFIMITDTAYLRDGFRFRIRNKSALNGDWDNWHVDYVLLDNNRSVIKDTAYDDVTYGYVPAPPFHKYTAMPWQQFNQAEQTFTITNRLRYNGIGSAGSPSVNTTYKHLIYNASGSLIHTMVNPPSDNITPFRLNGWVKQTSLAQPPLSYTLPTLTDSATYSIKHFVYRDALGATDINLNNDTVVTRFKFHNYYAFDDGSAERAYELRGAGAQLAYKISLNVTDTLRAVRIYFDKSSTQQASSSFFRLCIWSDGGGFPGTLLYRDSLQTPKFINTAYNAIPEYTLTSPKVLGNGTYFIGLQKFTTNDIVIGQDANSIKNTYLYFNTDGNWQQSAIPGAVMMRYVFGKKEQLPIGITENNSQDVRVVKMYPNPANDYITLDNISGQEATLDVLNVAGQLLDKVSLQDGRTIVSTSKYPSGLYFCMVRNSAGVLVQQQRLIIQH